MSSLSTEQTAAERIVFREKIIRELKNDKAKMDTFIKEVYESKNNNEANTTDYKKNLINYLGNNPVQLDKFMKDIYEQNKEPVYSILLVDASGSMSTRKTDTINGCREFLDGQITHLKGRKVTLFINYFNTERKNVYKGPLYNDKNQPLYFDALEQYTTGGMTKLFGSIIELIAEIKKEINNMVEKPIVVFTILTDGQDNRSGEITDRDVKNAIEESGWEFIYLRDKSVTLSAKDIGIKYDIKYDMDNSTEQCRAFNMSSAVFRVST